MYLVLFLASTISDSLWVRASDGEALEGVCAHLEFPDSFKGKFQISNQRARPF